MPGPAHPVRAAASTVTVASEPNALAAVLAARRQGSAVEVLPDRTDYSQVFANPDGTMTYDASWSPTWVRQGASWVRPDASLVQAADGSWSPAAAAAGLTLSGGGGTTLATVVSGGQSLSVSWPSALPPPTVSGATATYAGVFPGVNLVVTATTDGGFDETLVIQNQAAAGDSQLADLELGVSASSGLARTTTADGAVQWGTAAGGTVFSSSSPLAWDSAAGGSAAAGPGAGAQVAAAPATYSGSKVRLTVPQALLSGPASSFPVYVDPSYSVTSTELTHGMASSAYPTGFFWNTPPPMGVGNNSNYLIQRSYYRMTIPSQLTGSTILSATFNGTVTGASTSASTSHTVTLHSSGPISSATTWDNQPSWGASTPTTFTTASTTPNKAVSWNVESMVQSAVNGGETNWTVALTNASETSSTYWVSFSDDPTISITYDHPPAAPSALATSPLSYGTDGKLYTSSADPSFSATATDPDGDNVQYQVQVLSGSTVVASGTSPSMTSGTAGSWTDTTALTDGSTYTYQVRAYDGTEYGPWTSGQSFTVETDTPAAPTVTCSSYPSGTWSAQVASTTCSWNAPLAHMNGYSWELDGTWSWTTATSVTIEPGPGTHLVSVVPQSSAGVWGAHADYNFGVGVNGAMTAPADGSQTSTTVPLQADAPPGYTSATFYYREGTTGPFQQIPGATVESCGCSVTWPVSTTTNAAGVQTALLSWFVTRTVTDDGPVQIQAVFTNSSGGTDTTPPVTVTLDRVGTGADYGTTVAGPVTVGLQSGNAALSATDVSISSYGADLEVARTFNSVEPAVPSIFGPGWAASLTGGVTTSWTQLTVTSPVSGALYATLQSVDGTSDTFIGTTGGATTTWALTGDDAVTSGLTLTQAASGGPFTLTDSSGTVTAFSLDSNPALAASEPADVSVYVPQTVTPLGAAGSAGIVYDGTSTDASYGDPVLMVAPDGASSEPSTTACPYPASASTWTAGCRGLALSYNAAGDVSQISFEYVGNSGTFNSVPVADYGYDASGRLTSEWDPRLATPLVTGYTYDETAGDPDLGRITQVTPAQAAGSGALAPWTLTYDATVGSADYGNLLSVSQTHSAAYGGATATTTIDYAVPLTTAAGGPVNMDTGTVAGWAQTDAPTSAVAIFPPSHVPSSPPIASDWQYAQIDFYNASGQEVNTASYTGGAWAVTTTQYDAYGNTTWTLSAADRAAALASANPAGTATTLASVNVYACDNFGVIDPSCDNDDQQYEVLTDSYGPAHTADVDGTVETIRSRTAYTYDQGAPDADTDADGSPYMQVTSQTDSASVGDGLPGSATADARTTIYTYANSTTSIGWTLSQPLTIVTDPSGSDLVRTRVYNTNSSLYGGANLQTDSDMPSDTAGGGAGDTQTVYYTAGTNPVAAACGNKPEWADLTCQTGPAAQPGTAGLPSLPVTTYTYDDYLNVATKTEAFGSTGTRVTTTAYDAGERPVTQTIAVTGSGMGTAVPETQTAYSATSGLPTDTETLNSSGTVTADIKTTYDDFGDPRTYTDAPGNTTTYAYNLDGGVTSLNDGKGTETLTYDAAGDPTQIADSQAGTFAATYNPDGNLATETYPGGVTATYTYDPAGTTTSVSYDGASWSAPLNDTIVPDAGGDWSTEAITDTATPLTSTKVDTYDNNDRLTSIQDTLDGQCTTRAYAYNSDSDRTSLTTYAPGTSGACQDSTGTATSETYDSADRSINVGYIYDTQGDITTTPSADAGGAGNLTAAYYANGMLASQTQNGSTMTWALDPTLGRFAADTQNGVTYTDHYIGGGNDPAWTSGSDGSWTRNVTDFNGNLAAQVIASGVTLELPDLHGDIMATATTSPSASGPTGIYVYTEFGTPETGTPGAYGWLGADQISSNALGGEMLMGARAYNTNTGRFSQTDPIAAGSANAYDYADQNPVNDYDLTGQSSTYGVGFRDSCIHWRGWGDACVSLQMVCSYDWGCSITYGLHFTQRLQELFVTSVVFGITVDGYWVGSTSYSHQEYGWWTFHGAWGLNPGRGRGFFKCGRSDCWLTSSMPVKLSVRGTLDDQIPPYWSGFSITVGWNM
jgi:RHS repeat-associated protein